MMRRLWRNLLLLGTTFLCFSCVSPAPEATSEEQLPSSSIEESSLESLEESSSEESSAEPDPGYRYEELGDFTWRDIALSLDQDAIPSTGSHRILVLPIQLYDEPFIDSALSDLDRVLNGNGYEDTHYWESLASYYEKSSYGKLHLSFEIASIYNAVDSNGNLLGARDLYNLYHASDLGTMSIEAAYRQYIQQEGVDAAKALDQDKNGYIDGIIAVYSASYWHNWDSYNYYWAYTSWAAVNNYEGTTLNRPDLDLPGFNLYFWMSVNFIYFYGEFEGEEPVDAHTLIHETGHMLGLPDYYPYGDSNYNAAGCLMMMDNNVLDHDMFSKLSLRWADPYLVYDDAEITLKPYEESGECIIIPAPSSYNGTAFSEYLLIELYTPTGLNELDSTYVYENRYLGYNEPGLRIYHIDARVMDYNAYRLNMGDHVTYVTLEQLGEEGMTYYVPASNSYKAITQTSTFSLIHLLEAGRRNTFATGGHGTNDTLFKEGDYFTASEFTSFFPNRTKFNNGDPIHFDIDIKSLNEEAAHLVFTRVH